MERLVRVAARRLLSPILGAHVVDAAEISAAGLLLREADLTPSINANASAGPAAISVAGCHVTDLQLKLLSNLRPSLSVGRVDVRIEVRPELLAAAQESAVVVRTEPAERPQMVPTPGPLQNAAATVARLVQWFAGAAAVSISVINISLEVRLPCDNTLVCCLTLGSVLIRRQSSGHSGLGLSVGSLAATVRLEERSRLSETSTLIRDGAPVDVIGRVSLLPHSCAAADAAQAPAAGSAIDQTTDALSIVWSLDGFDADTSCPASLAGLPAVSLRLGELSIEGSAVGLTRLASMLPGPTSAPAPAPIPSPSHAPATPLGLQTPPPVESVPVLATEGTLPAAAGPIGGTAAIGDAPLASTAAAGDAPSIYNTATGGDAPTHISSAAVASAPVVPPSAAPEFTPKGLWLAIDRRVRGWISFFASPPPDIMTAEDDATAPLAEAAALPASAAEPAADATLASVPPAAAPFEGRSLTATPRLGVHVHLPSVRVRLLAPPLGSLSVTLEGVAAHAALHADGASFGMQDCLVRAGQARLELSRRIASSGAASEAGVADAVSAALEIGSSEASIGGAPIAAFEHSFPLMTISHVQLAVPEAESPGPRTALKLSCEQVSVAVSDADVLDLLRMAQYVQAAGVASSVCTDTYPSTAARMAAKLTLRGLALGLGGSSLPGAAGLSHAHVATLRFSDPVAARVTEVRLDSGELSLRSLQAGADLPAVILSIVAAVPLGSADNIAPQAGFERVENSALVSVAVALPEVRLQAVAFEQVVLLLGHVSDLIAQADELSAPPTPISPPLLHESVSGPPVAESAIQQPVSVFVGLLNVDAGLASVGSLSAVSAARLSIQGLSVRTAALSSLSHDDTTTGSLAGSAAAPGTRLSISARGAELLTRCAIGEYTSLLRLLPPSAIHAPAFSLTKNSRPCECLSDSFNSRSPTSTPHGATGRSRAFTLPTEEALLALGSVTLALQHHDAIALIQPALLTAEQVQRAFATQDEPLAPACSSAPDASLALLEAPSVPPSTVCRCVACLTLSTRQLQVQWREGAAAAADGAMLVLEAEGLELAAVTQSAGDASLLPALFVSADKIALSAGTVAVPGRYVSFSVLQPALARLTLLNPTEAFHATSLHIGGIEGRLLHSGIAELSRAQSLLVAEAVAVAALTSPSDTTVQASATSSHAHPHTDGVTSIPEAGTATPPAAPTGLADAADGHLAGAGAAKLTPEPAASIRSSREQSARAARGSPSARTGVASVSLLGGRRAAVTSRSSHSAALPGALSSPPRAAAPVFQQVAGAAVRADTPVSSLAVAVTTSPHRAPAAAVHDRGARSHPWQLSWEAACSPTLRESITAHLETVNSMAPELNACSPHTFGCQEAAAQETLRAAVGYIKLQLSVDSPDASPAVVPAVAAAPVPGVARSPGEQYVVVVELTGLGAALLREAFATHSTAQWATVVVGDVTADRGSPPRAGRGEAASAAASRGISTMQPPGSAMHMRAAVQLEDLALRCRGRAGEVGCLARFASQEQSGSGAPVTVTPALAIRVCTLQEASLGTGELAPTTVHCNGKLAPLAVKASPLLSELVAALALPNAAAASHSSAAGAVPEVTSPAAGEPGSGERSYDFGEVSVGSELLIQSAALEPWSLDFSFDVPTSPGTVATRTGPPLVTVAGVTLPLFAVSHVRLDLPGVSASGVHSPQAVLESFGRSYARSLLAQLGRVASSIPGSVLPHTAVARTAQGGALSAAATAQWAADQAAAALTAARMLLASLSPRAPAVLAEASAAAQSTLGAGALVAGSYILSFLPQLPPLGALGGVALAGEAAAAPRAASASHTHAVAAASSAARPAPPSAPPQSQKSGASGEWELL